MVRPSARFNENCVKPQRHRGKGRIGCYVMGRRPDNPAALRGRYGIRGTFTGLSCLDLDKGDDPSPAHDKIDLARRGTDTGIQNTVAFQPKGDRRPDFRPPPAPLTGSALRSPVTPAAIRHLAG